MLVQLSVRNLLSFGEEQVFSMLAAPGERQHPHHVVQAGPHKLLRAAAVYGANGAGKSNLVQALLLTKKLVVQGTRPGQSLPLPAFRLAGNLPPTRIELGFILDEVPHTYGFEAEANRILAEWLYAAPRGRSARLFERETTSEGVTKVDAGPGLVGRSTTMRARLRFVAEGTRPNQLFLAEAAERNVQELDPVRRWFSESLSVVPADSRYDPLEFHLHDSEEFAGFVSTFLQQAGAGVSSVVAKETPIEWGQRFGNLSEEERSRIPAIFDALPRGALLLTDDDGRRAVVARGATGETVELALRTRHFSAHGDSVEFLPEEESDGTQRLIHLAPVLYTLTSSPGRVAVVDELDRRLHPMLSRSFISSWLGCRDGEEGHPGQLVFTTHDTNLLDLDLLRRDEIWFAEKDAGGASHLYSLAEFRIRNDLKVSKGYLQGRFGAIPFLGDMSGLCSPACSEEDQGNGDAA